MHQCPRPQHCKVVHLPALLAILTKLMMLVRVIATVSREAGSAC